MKFFVGIFLKRQSFRPLVVLLSVLAAHHAASSALSSAEDAKIALASGGQGRTESKAWKSALGGIRAKLDAIKTAKNSAAGLDAATDQANDAIKQFEADVDADDASAATAKKDDAKKAGNDSSKPAAPAATVTVVAAQSSSADKTSTPSSVPVPVKKDDSLSDNDDGGNKRLRAKINLWAERAVREALEKVLGSIDLRSGGQKTPADQQKSNVDSKALVAQVVQQVTPALGQAIASEIVSDSVSPKTSNVNQNTSSGVTPVQASSSAVATTLVSVARQENAPVQASAPTSANVVTPGTVLQISGAVSAASKAVQADLSTSSIDRSTPVVVPADFAKVGDADLTKVTVGLVDGQLSIWGLDRDAKLYKSIRDKKNALSFVLADPVSTKGESLVGITDVAMATDGTLYLAANNKIYAYHHANVPAPQLPRGSKKSIKQHKTTTPYVWEEMVLAGNNVPTLRAVSVGGRNNVIAWNPGQNNLYRVTQDGVSPISKKNCVFARVGNDGAVYLIGDDGAVNVLRNDQWHIISGSRKFRCVAGSKNNLWGIVNDAGDDALELGLFNQGNFEPVLSADGAIARGFVSVNVAGDQVVLLDKNGVVYKREKGMSKRQGKKGNKVGDAKPEYVKHVSDDRADQDAGSDVQDHGYSQKKSHKGGKNAASGDKFTTRFGAIRDNLTNIENRDVIRRAVNAVLDALEAADGKLLSAKDQDILVSNLHLLASDKVKSVRMTRYVSALVRLVLREKVLDDARAADAQKMATATK